MNRWDRHITKMFACRIMATLFLLIAITFLIDGVEKIRWLTYGSLALGDYIGFLAYRSLLACTFLLPAAVVLAATLATSTLIREGALPTIAQSGFSTTRALLPIFACTVLLGGLEAYLISTTIPMAYAQLAAFSPESVRRIRPRATPNTDGWFYRPPTAYHVIHSKADGQLDIAESFTMSHTGQLKFYSQVHNPLLSELGWCGSDAIALQRMENEKFIPVTPVNACIHLPVSERFLRSQLLPPYALPTEILQEVVDMNVLVGQPRVGTRLTLFLRYLLPLSLPLMTVGASRSASIPRYQATAISALRRALKTMVLFTCLSTAVLLLVWMKKLEPLTGSITVAISWLGCQLIQNVWNGPGKTSKLSAVLS